PSLTGQRRGREQVSQELTTELSRLENLRHAESEAKQVSQFVKAQPGRVLLGRNATEGALRLARRPSLWHFSGHAIYVEGRGNGEQTDPLLGAAVVLAGAKQSRGQEGVVTALKVSGLDLEGTELVFLSGC